MASLVTVATYETSHEAQLARARLAEHGIPATIRGEHHNRLFGGMGAIAGSIDVQVHPDDEEAARNVLSVDVSGYDEFLTSLEAGGDFEGEEEEEVHSDDRCPVCGADAVIVEKRSPVVWLFVILFLGIPLLFLKRTHECAICGNVWKQ